ncbi:hypothetical protein C9F11_17640 [Streptomyces sp. YIM 121038]|uniref:hypothetical protein n=1 Tax=unclassified Streptomyces TaxID=2593676 RepID=UPI001110B01D|nr:MULTISPECIES: hypothetical protein [unclassified Streptomyces]QCX77181.1 hypothetical protein C9F11_17640 [Streptomyces sp. YIM 121038]
MFDGASIVQQTSVALFAAVTTLWAVTFLRLRRGREAGPQISGAGGPALRSLPVQSGPPGAESVQLTAAERAAFAGLVRQFGKGRDQA